MFHFITVHTLERKKRLVWRVTIRMSGQGQDFCFGVIFLFFCFWMGVNTVCLALACEAILEKEENKSRQRANYNLFPSLA